MATIDSRIDNPYSAPKAEVADAAEAEFQPVKVFSVSGRIGRVRYIGYSVGFALLIGLAIGVVAGFLGAVGVGRNLGAGVGYVAWAVLIAVQIMLAIQRCHDFNSSGWWSVFSILPLIGLLFWLIPGTDGANRFGARTPPNTTGAVLGALVLPLIVVVGIVAAVAIPAYQQYTMRAQQKMGR